MCWLRRRGHTTMRPETRFLSLKTPVTIGSRFGEWEVSWLGGWTRHRLSYLVMVVRGHQTLSKINPGSNTMVKRTSMLR